MIFVWLGRTVRLQRVHPAPEHQRDGGQGLRPAPLQGQEGAPALPQIIHQVRRVLGVEMLMMNDDYDEDDGVIVIVLTLRLSWLSWFHDEDYEYSV